MDWKPIETAPEDTWVLGYFPKGEYNEILTVFRTDRGGSSTWYGDHHSVIHGNQKTTDPTHWMPLPEPPQ